MQWLAHFISALFRNSAMVGLITAAVEADPSVPSEVRNDFEVAASLGFIWANKQPGTLVYKLDADGSESTIRHITF